VCTEDYQCEVSHYCWYASKEDRESETKKCMELYSKPAGTKFGWHQESQSGVKATLAEYTQNGKYCVQGLAFPLSETEAQCTKTDEIHFDNVVTNAPYNCTATDPNKKCQIWYELGTPQEEHVEVFCRCSMSD